MEEYSQIEVFGGSSWATEIVKMLCENLEEVGWYMHNENTIAHLLEYEHNPNYLSSVEFDIDQLHLGSDMKAMVDYADYLIFVILSAFLQTELNNIQPECLYQQRVV